MDYNEYKDMEQDVIDAVGGRSVAMDYVEAASIVMKIEEAFRKNKINEDVLKDYLSSHIPSETYYPKDFDWHKFGIEMSYAQHTKHGTTIESQLENMGFGEYITEIGSFEDVHLKDEGYATVSVITDEYLEKYGHKPNLFYEEAPDMATDHSIKTGELLKIRLDSTEHSVVKDIVVQFRDMTYYNRKTGEIEKEQRTAKITEYEKLPSIAKAYSTKQIRAPYIIDLNSKGQYEISFKRAPAPLTKEYVLEETEKRINKRCPYETGDVCCTRINDKIIVEEVVFDRAELNEILEGAYMEFEKTAQLLAPRESDKYVEFDNVVDNVFAEMARDEQEARERAAAKAKSKGKPSKGRSSKKSSQEITD